MFYDDLFQMMYSIKIDGFDAFIHIINSGADDGAFFGLLIEEEGTKYVVGQIDLNESHYQFAYIREQFVFDIVKGVLDWEHDSFWMSDQYIYGQEYGTINN